MKKFKKSTYKHCILLTIIFFLFLFCSYEGVFIFNKGFNEFDYLMFNIFGDGIIVAIATYFSTKQISNQVSRNEFNRYNRINVTMNKSRNRIINYESFMEIYENDKCFFGVSEDNRKTII